MLILIIILFVKTNLTDEREARDTRRRFGSSALIALNVLVTCRKIFSRSSVSDMSGLSGWYITYKSLS